MKKKVKKAKRVSCDAVLKLLGSLKGYLEKGGNIEGLLKRLK
jgi:hypothetical protein